MDVRHTAGNTDSKIHFTACVPFHRLPISYVGDVQYGTDNYDISGSFGAPQQPLCYRPARRDMVITTRMWEAQLQSTIAQAMQRIAHVPYRTS